MHWQVRKSLKELRESEASKWLQHVMHRTLIFVIVLIFINLIRYLKRIAYARYRRKTESRVTFKNHKILSYIIEGSQAVVLIAGGLSLFIGEDVPNLVKEIVQALRNIASFGGLTTGLFDGIFGVVGDILATFLSYGFVLLGIKNKRVATYLASYKRGKKILFKYYSLSDFLGSEHMDDWEESQRKYAAREGDAAVETYLKAKSQKVKYQFLDKLEQNRLERLAREKYELAIRDGKGSEDHQFDWFLDREYRKVYDESTFDLTNCYHIRPSMNIRPVKVNSLDVKAKKLYTSVCELKSGKNTKAFLDECPTEESRSETRSKLRTWVFSIVALIIFVFGVCVFLHYYTKAEKKDRKKQRLQTAPAKGKKIVAKRLTPKRESALFETIGELESKVKGGVGSLPTTCESDIGELEGRKRFGRRRHGKNAGVNVGSKDYKKFFDEFGRQPYSKHEIIKYVMKHRMADELSSDTDSEKELGYARDLYDDYQPGMRWADQTEYVPYGDNFERKKFVAVKEVPIDPPVKLGSDNPPLRKFVAVKEFTVENDVETQTQALELALGPPKPLVLPKPQKVVNQVGQVASKKRNRRKRKKALVPESKLTLIPKVEREETKLESVYAGRPLPPPVVVSGDRDIAVWIVPSGGGNWDFSGNAFCVGDYIETASHVVESFAQVKLEYPAGSGKFFITGKWERIPGQDRARIPKPPAIIGLKSWSSSACRKGSTHVFLSCYDGDRKMHFWMDGDINWDGEKSEFSHSVSTKDGFSGGAIIDAATGTVLGLHTRGFTGKHGSNYGELVRYDASQYFVGGATSKGGIASK